MLHVLIEINRHIGGWDIKWRDKKCSDWIGVGKYRMGSRHWKAEVLSTMFIIIIYFSIEINKYKISVRLSWNYNYDNP